MKKHNYDNKINISLILLIISVVLILFIFVILVILINKILKHNKTYKNKANENFNDYFDCYLKLTDINPQFVKQYMKFDNQHVSKGRCKDARLHVFVEPCPLDNNGIPLSSCQQNATLTSSKGNPLIFPYDVTPFNISNYFGITPTEKINETL